MFTGIGGLAQVHRGQSARGDPAHPQRKRAVVRCRRQPCVGAGVGDRGVPTVVAGAKSGVSDSARYAPLGDAAAGRQCVQRGDRGKHHTDVAPRQAEFCVAAIVAVPANHDLFAGPQCHRIRSVSPRSEGGVGLAGGSEGVASVQTTLWRARAKLPLLPATLVAMDTALPQGLKAIALT